MVFNKHFLLLQFGYLIFSLNAVFSKLAALSQLWSMRFFLCYACALACLFVFAIIWQQVLKAYDLIIAYSWKSMVFLWVFLWSVLLFRETITINNMIGAGLIIIGMCMVNKYGE